MPPLSNQDLAVTNEAGASEGGASYVPTDLGHVKMKRDIRPTYEVTHVKDT